MSQSISVHRAIGNRVGESEAMAELGGLVAVKQFRFQEAEDLIRQSLSLAPETNRFGIAYGLGQLCRVQLLTGQFAEAEATLWIVWPSGRISGCGPGRSGPRLSWPRHVCIGERILRLASWQKQTVSRAQELWLGPMASAMCKSCSARWRWSKLRFLMRTNVCRKA